MKNPAQFLRFFVILCLSGLMFMACSKKMADSRIMPPIPGLDPKFAEFQLDASKGNTLTLESGTTISIPPDCFADEKGNLISGKVTLNYRELADAIDIFLSGIPMDFDSFGQTRQMTTGGMFEIRANLGDKSLEIKEGKQIQVNFGSKMPGDQFDFFGYNESSQQWEYIDRPASQPNQDKALKMKQLLKRLPKLPMPLTKEYFAFSLRRFMDVWLNDDYDAIYRANEKNFAQKAKVYGLRFIELDIRNEIRFKGRRYDCSEMVWKNLSMKIFPSWTHKITEYSWDEKKREYNYNAEIKSLGNNVYEFKLRGDKGEKFTFKAEAIMPLRQLLRQKPELLKEEYDRIMAEVAEDRKRIEQEAEVYRLASVYKMGIYNFDCLLKIENTLPLAAQFNVQGQTREQLNWKQVYTFVGKGAVVKTYAKESDKYRYFKNQPVFIMMLISGNQVAFFSKENYERINADSLMQISNPQMEFTLTPSAQLISSSDDLRKILGLE